MTSGNDPFDDPFGSGERTVIRPNPGARRPGAPGQPPGMPPGAPPGQPGAGNPFGAPQPPGYPPQQPAGYPPQPPAGYPPQGYPPQQPPAGYPPQPPQGYPPQPGYDPHMAMAPEAGAPAMIAMPGDNPFLAAAGPLLNLLGRLRNSMSGVSIAQLQNSVVQAIDAFEAESGARGAKREHIPYAKYALAALADDVVQNLPIEDRHIWTAHPMVARYFNGDREAGVRFFQNLDGLRRNPGEYYDVVEFYHTCLALGFEGIHRHSGGGQGELQRIRYDTHAALRGTRSNTGWVLSPRWKGKDLARRSIGMQIPFWAVAAVVLVLIAGLFFTLRSLLGGDTDALAGEIRKIHPDSQLELVRIDDAGLVIDPPDPPDPIEVPPTGQLQRIRDALQKEIAAGDISADYLDANYIIVQLPNKLLFDSGSADVSAAFQADLAVRLGQMFKAEVALLEERGFQHGQVIAVGHSDAQPLSSSSRWKSNWELSQARAESVARAVYAHSPQDFAILVEGRGPDDPLCRPAEDRSCWSRNRRVELLIERTR